MFGSLDVDRDSEGFRSRWIWIIPPFIVLGLAATLVMVSLADHVGVTRAALGLVIAPFALVLVVIGLRRGFALLNKMRARLGHWDVLWLLLFASALVFRVRSATDIRANPVDSWAVYRIALEVGVGVVLFTHLVLRRPEWLGSMFRGFIGALTAFGIVSLASTAWSVYPAWTLYKSCEYLLDVALLAAILVTIRSARAYKHFVNWTWVLYGLLLLSVWLGVVVWPQQELYPVGFKIGLLGVRLTGVVPDVSSNDVGTFGAILALVSLCRLLPIAGRSSERIWYTLLFTASTATMILSQTRSAMAGFLFGVFLMLLFSKRLGLSAFLSFVVGPLLLLTSLGGLVWAFLKRGETAQVLGTLSSRTIWWSYALQKFLERPLTGFGAYAAGRFAVLATHGLTVTSTLHSDYLEIIVGTGIWGLIPALAALLGTWWFLVRYLQRSSEATLERQLAYEAVAVLGLLTFRSIFMTMLTWHPPLDFLVILGTAEFLRRREIRETSHPVQAPDESSADAATVCS